MSIKNLAAALLLTISASVLSAQSAQAINGFISENQCGASHAAPSASATKCVKGCVARGAAPVLVSDGKVYKLKGEDDAVKGLAGQNVTIKGTVDGDTITVTSVTAQKS
ncbi:MAG: DUF5818 domain-containing protein [Silvibacterium sp.]